ncbi:MAG: DUF4058 family protein [Cyanobacteriota bacterium]|nr:DUF4058 family protein [Cyanobacteriota bacterium]
MPSPFPGMDPYLEHPELWPGVHLFLISFLAQSLSPQLRPVYSVSVEVRMYETTDEQSLLVGIPDVSVLSKRGQVSTPTSTSQVAVATPTTTPRTVRLPMPITVRQGYLEIKEAATKEVVTTIEILSPVNKRSGKGRDAYLAKREEILGSLTNFVEIDLLRFGEPMPILNKGLDSHYRILVSRGKDRPKADLYAFNLQNPIAPFPLPLRPGDTEPIIDLRSLLTNIYDVCGYDLKIDYTTKAIPPLSKKDAPWADALLRQQGLR